VTAPNPHIARLEQDLHDRLIAELGDQSATGLARWVQGRFARIAELGRLNTEFDSRYQAALDEEDRRGAILDLARRLGASEHQLAGDAAAFDRYFDRDAAIERVQRRIGDEERAAQFGLDRLGGMGDETLGCELVEDALTEAWNYSRDRRLRDAGFRCLRLALEGSAKPQLRQSLLGAVQRTALQVSDSTWSQCEAMTALSLVSARSAGEVFRRRLTAPLPGDDLFVRRHAVRLTCRRRLASRVQQDLVALAAQDPSPAVRQCLADELHHCPPDLVAQWTDALMADPAPQVRVMLIAREPARRGTRVRNAAHCDRERTGRVCPANRLARRIAMVWAAAGGERGGASPSLGTDYPRSFNTPSSAESTSLGGRRGRTAVVFRRCPK